METEISQVHDEATDTTYHQQPQQYFRPPSPNNNQYEFPITTHQQHRYKKDPFADIDKTTYIIIFVAFIIGFFMGKTMQPVILKTN